MTDEDSCASSASSMTVTRQESATSSRLIRLQKTLDSETMGIIQKCIGQTVEMLLREPERDLLFQDFMTFETLGYPSKNFLPTYQQGFAENKFTNYAPIAFKCFRNLFQIDIEDFLNSMCSAPFKQLFNPGASGSIFYVTQDDKYILKTVQQREAEFLLKLLPGYYLNLTQNPHTLLPKFFGFYSVRSLNRSIRIIVMNNLIPSNIAITRKYDLKGSTIKRKATPEELRKEFPTFKDLDFVSHYPEGLVLDPETYTCFSNCLKRDCRVLESFKIIDYSLLLAVHQVDRKPNVKKFTCRSESAKDPSKGFRAKTADGNELLLFAGIIDILQSYEIRKKFEHTLKSIVYKRDSLSVHRPDFYNQRFQDFILNKVFRLVPSKSQPNAVQTESEIAPQKISTSGPADKTKRETRPYFNWAPTQSSTFSGLIKNESPFRTFQIDYLDNKAESKIKKIAERKISADTDEEVKKETPTKNK